MPVDNLTLGGDPRVGQVQIENSRLDPSTFDPEITRQLEQQARLNKQGRLSVGELFDPRAALDPRPLGQAIYSLYQSFRTPQQEQQAMQEYVRQRLGYPQQ